MQTELQYVIAYLLPEQMHSHNKSMVKGKSNIIHANQTLRISMKKMEENITQR